MRARKRFAQHFLEPAWVAKVVKAVDARPDDSILEIGPGRAAMTRPLAAQCGRLLAVEVDRDLAADLEVTKPANVTVIVGDVLQVDFAAVLSDWLGVPLGTGDRVRVVGNLPYNISSPILFSLLALSAATGGVRDAILMLQKEVADRLVAKVGTGDYGVLTVLTGRPRRCHSPPVVAAGRVPASAAGPFRGGPPGIPATRRRHPRHGRVRPHGADHVHAAPQDPVERPEEVWHRAVGGAG